MTLTVAIASENNSFDREVYRFLLERVLGQPVTAWTGTFTFNGCRSVAKVAPAFLLAAEAAGVKHGLFAIDNDGGARRRPEHDAADVAPPFDIDDDETCRECWLTSALPASWQAGSGKLAIVVPVQLVETWLLVLRGDLREAPERSYARAALKKLFFGKPIPSLATCLQLAMAQLQKPDALATLRQRPSFQRFEARAAGWR